MTGRDSRTLLSAFRKCDFAPQPHEKIQFKQIEQALFGEEHAEKVRGLRLDNEQKERDAKVESGALVEIQFVQTQLAQRVQSIRLAVDNCPPDATEWRDKVLLPAVTDLLGVK